MLIRKENGASKWQSHHVSDYLPLRLGNRSMALPASPGTASHWISRENSFPRCGPFCGMQSPTSHPFSNNRKCTIFLAILRVGSDSQFEVNRRQTVDVARSIRYRFIFKGAPLGWGGWLRAENGSRGRLKPHTSHRPLPRLLHEVTVTQGELCGMGRYHLTCPLKHHQTGLLRLS